MSAGLTNYCLWEEEQIFLLESGVLLQQFKLDVGKVSSVKVVTKGDKRVNQLALMRFPCLKINKVAEMVFGVGGKKVLKTCFLCLEPAGN